MMHTSYNRQAFSSAFRIVMFSVLLCGCLAPRSQEPNSAENVEIRLTVLPKGIGSYAPLPDPVWIAAGGVPSPAHQADVVIKIEPADAGFGVQVRLISGKGQERHATLAFANQAVMADGAPVLLTTNDVGVFAGELTSSDTLGTCTIQVSVLGTTNKVEKSVEFNWMLDDAQEWIDARWNNLGNQGGNMHFFDYGDFHGPEVGLVTNTTRFMHYRAPDHNAPKLPLDNHEIRCFVEEVVYVDENGEQHRIINTPDNPTEMVGDWAVFLAPAQTDANGYATVVLDVRRAGIDYMRIGTYDFSTHRDPTPKYDSRFGIKHFDHISFNQSPLQAVVHRLNQHLQADDAYSAEHVSDMKMIPIREVQLELPEGMPGGPVTFRTSDIEFDVVLAFVTQIAEVTYQVDGDVIRILPWLHNRPIPRDELTVESISQRIASVFCQKQKVNVSFSEAGLAKAKANGLVESILRELSSPFGPSTKMESLILSDTGKHQFSELITKGSVGAADDDGIPYTGLFGTPVISGCRILRASFETNASVLVFRDYETDEPVAVDMDRVYGVSYDDKGRMSPISPGRRDAQNQSLDRSDFILIQQPSEPSPRPGIYVYYEVGIEEIRPEDKDYFDWQQHRLEQLFEHELGYLVRIPGYLNAPE